MSRARQSKSVVKDSDAFNPPLTDSQRNEVVALAKRTRATAPPPRFKAIGANKVGCADDVDLAVFAARMAAAVGTTDQYTANVLLGQGAATVEDEDLATRCNTIGALLTAIRPRTELEGLLAVQMVGCHNLGMMMLRRATHAERVDFMNTYGNLGAKLLRVFTAQLEALGRLRGNTTQQTVRVEHVTVESGGQAVVGAVATGSAVDGKKT